MRVYLADYELYKVFTEKDYGDLCFPRNGSAVFTSLEKAHKTTMEEIAAGFVGDDYGPEERERCYRGYFRINEKDTEDKSVDIEHFYNFKGELTDRYDNNDPFGEKSPDAGRKFKPGDYVRLVHPITLGGIDYDTDAVFVMGFAKDRDFLFFVPLLSDCCCYPLFLTDEGNTYFYKLQERDFEPYTGDVPENLAILRKILVGETKISLGRIKELFGQAVAEDHFIKRVIESENLTDESTDTAAVLRRLLGRHETLPDDTWYGLMLPKGISYRCFKTGKFGFPLVAEHWRKTECGFVTAFRGDRTREQNKERSDQLVRELQSSRLSYIKAAAALAGGSSDGHAHTTEDTFCVVNTKFTKRDFTEFMVHLCKKYDQDTVLVTTPVSTVPRTTRSALQGKITTDGVYYDRDGCGTMSITDAPTSAISGFFARIYGKMLTFTESEYVEAPGYDVHGVGGRRLAEWDFAALRRSWDDEGQDG